MLREHPFARVPWRSTGGGVLECRPPIERSFEDVLPDEIRKQIECEELATSLKAQGVSLARPWRATRTALGTSWMFRFVAGEVLVALPTVVLVSCGLHQRRPLVLVWVVLVALIWRARGGRLSCVGCVGSAAIPVVIGGVLASLDRSVVVALGGLCVPWTWWIGMEVRKYQVDAIVARLANRPECYALLLANGSIEGPANANVSVATRRSDEIESGSSPSHSGGRRRGS